MITDSEFLLIRNYDRNLREHQDSAQRVVNSKNAQIINHSRIIVAQGSRIAALEAALSAERTKTQSLMQQLQRFMKLH